MLLKARRAGLCPLLKFFTRQTDKTEREIYNENALLKQMAMVFLFRHGGLMMIETAQIMNLDSGTVSKRKRRLKETLKNDKGLRLLLVSKERLAKSKELSPERVVLIHNLLPQGR